MAKKYLDDIGLSHFFDKLKLLFATKDAATQSADGLMSSLDKTKLDGLDQLVGSATGESVTAGDSSCLESLIVYGKSVQNGTPTPSNPVEIQVVGLNDDNEFGIKIGETLYLIDLQGNELASLPDGTKDVLSVDALGHVTITKRTGKATLDGSKSWGVNPNVGTGFAYTARPSDMASGDGVNSLGLFMVDRFKVAMTGGGNVYASGPNLLFYRNDEFNPSDGPSAKSWFTSNPVSMVYKLASSSAVDLGYIDMPDIPNGSQVSITASIVPNIEASWWTKYAEPIARVIDSIKNLVI